MRFAHTMIRVDDRPPGKPLKGGKSGTSGPGKPTPSDPTRPGLASSLFSIV